MPWFCFPTLSWLFNYPKFSLLRNYIHIYMLGMQHIPNAFARKHLVKVPMEITLWDPNGIRWEVLCKCHSKRTSFTAGWYRFSLVNNLERNDVCIFELIKSNEMRVHIFRVVEEITPLIKWKKWHKDSWSQENKYASNF